MSERLTRAEASRRNGSRSHGPVSVEGKAQSRRNGLKHGLSARKLLLTQAEQQQFERQLAIHAAFFQPQTPSEVERVTELAHASHNQDRAEALLLDLVDREIQRASGEAPEDTTTSFTQAYANLEFHLSRLFNQRLAAPKNKKCTYEPKPAA